MMKIIIRLKGGLGNQLFQYATGRKLMIERKGDLFIDTSLLDKKIKNVTFRKYELENFNIVGKILKESDIDKIKLPNTRLEIFLAIHGFTYKKNQYLFEKKSGMQPELKQNSEYIILDGYWQNEKNFIEIRSQLLNELTLKQPSKEFLKIKSIINLKQNSVSVHIRRGDYITNPTAANTHGLCSWEYYLQAINILKSKITKPYFYFFSDDPTWVETKINSIAIPHTNISHEYNLTNYEELMLMRQCNNHIIANSSFSWWGAWLSNNRDKIVIAPRKWFIANLNSENIIPKRWIMI